jgi:HlyD family secretion protein
MSRKAKVVTIVVSLVLVGIVAAVVAAKSRDKAVAVQTEKVERADLVQLVSATGKVKPVVEVQISANVSGEIKKLGVKEGDAVKKGDFLVQLDPSRFAAAVAQAEAAVGSAEANAKLAAANREQAEAKLARMRELLNQKLVAPEQFELVETQAKVGRATAEAAQGAVAQARAALDQAKDELSKTVILSPMAGTVSRLDKEVGEIAMGSTFTKDVVMVVADLSAMEIVAEVNENDVPDVKLGDAAVIEVDAIKDVKFNGTVKDISRSATVSGVLSQEQTTNFDVKVGIAGDVARLRPGMSATVDIQVATKKAVLAVPIQSLTKRDPTQTGDRARNLARVREEDLKDIVFKLEGGRAKAVVVATGISSESKIEVTGDLKEGDEVVSGPYKTLNKEVFDGDLLKVDNTGAAAVEK